MQPAVSIIVPCYKCETTIEETIHGLLEQTETDWECILVSDDGKSYLEFLADKGIRDDRIVEHPERSCGTGTVAPRNRGFDLVRGRFIADLDSDDIWKPDRLSRLVPLADRFGCAQDVLECFDITGPIGCSGPIDGTEAALHPDDVLTFDFPFHLVVRRDVAGDCWSPYDSWVPDVIRAVRLAERAPIQWLRAPLLKYRVSTSSMSQSLDGAARIDAAYEDVLRALDEGDGYRLAGPTEEVMAHGIARKKALNLRYMAEMKANPHPIPFIAWVLDRGVLGEQASTN